MVVKAEAEPELGALSRAIPASRPAISFAASVDDGGSIQLNTSRSEPRIVHSAASSAAASRAHRARMSAAGDEAELVQPAAHDRCVVAVQVEELDTFIAQRGNSAQRSLEIAGAVLAHACRASDRRGPFDLHSACCAAMKSRYQ